MRFGNPVSPGAIAKVLSSVLYDVERMSLSAILLKVGAMRQSIFNLLSSRLCWPLNKAEVMERCEYSKLSLDPTNEFSIDEVSLNLPVRLSPFCKCITVNRYLSLSSLME